MKKLKEEYIRLSSSERIYQLDKPVIALTGGIATGKSTVTEILKKHGFQIIDADQLVKSIYQQEETKTFIKAHYPEVFSHDEINFPKLRELFFESHEVKKRIENFIYQKLPKAFKEASAEISSQNFYFYDIPLLFEKSLQGKVDLSIVVYAPMEIQLARLIARDKTKEDVAKKILVQQMNIEDKRNMSDFVIDNSDSKIKLAAEVEKLLLQIFS